MPRLGDFMTEGTVVRLARSQGDEVNQGEVIAEIETEKLNYDLESVAGGRFHPVVDEGATVAVDGLIGYVLAEAKSRQPRKLPRLRPQGLPRDRLHSGVRRRVGRVGDLCARRRARVEWRPTWESIYRR